MIKMKDLTGKSKFWNAPIANPTQTAFARFARVPHGEMRSAFSDSVKEFTELNPLRTRKIETPFSDILGPLVLGGEEDDDRPKE